LGPRWSFPLTSTIRLPLVFLSGVERASGLNTHTIDCSKALMYKSDRLGGKGDMGVQTNWGFSRFISEAEAEESEERARQIGEAIAKEENYPPNALSLERSDDPPGWWARAEKRLSDR